MLSVKIRFTKNPMPNLFGEPMINDTFLFGIIRRMCCLCILLPGVFCLLMPSALATADSQAPRENPPPQPRASSSHALGILRIGMNISDVENLDPHTATGAGERVISDMVFSRLVRYKPGNCMDIEPDMAEQLPEPEMLDDRQVWKFRLRQGVMFHPGLGVPPHEMTAADVLFSLQRPKNLMAFRYGEEYNEMTLEKTGTHSFSIILKHPLSPNMFLPVLALDMGGFILSRHSEKSVKTHPVGTGPFQFDKITPGQKITLTANAEYFRGQPHLHRVELLSVPDADERKTRLKSGELDMADDMELSSLARESGTSDSIATDFQGFGEIVMIHFNVLGRPLDDRRVRLAIAYALNKEIFQKQFDHGILRPVDSPVPSHLMPGGLRPEKVSLLGLDYPADPGKARKLLAEAGYPRGFPLGLVTSERPAYRKYYESMRDQLAQAGIECRLRVVPHADMHDMIRKDANAVVVYIGWRPDADTVLTRFFHSDSIVRIGVRPDTNFSHYRKIDRLIEDARAETDADEQIRLWRYAQLMVLDHLVAYPLHHINLNPIRLRNKRFDYGYELLTPEPNYPRITETSRKGNPDK